MLQALARGFRDTFAGTQQRSLENPAVSLNDPSAYDLFTGGATSLAGVKVSRHTALSLSAMWRGVNLITSRCAALGMHRMRRTEGEGKERDTQHPTYRLVRYEPNEFMTGKVFWRTIIGHAIFGNGYAYIERDNSGMPRALLPLSPHCTYPERKDGKLRYLTFMRGADDTSNRQFVIQPQDMLHIKGFSYDGIAGYSVLDVLADTIGGALATRNHAVKFFKDGTMVSGVIEVTSGMDPKSQHALVENWKKLYTGLDNAHRTALLTHGAKFNPMTMDAEKAQVLESRQFDRIEVANVLGLPPHKVGDMSRSAYNSLESEERSLLSDALEPWLGACEDECDAKLLTEQEKAANSHCFRVNRMAAIQSDSKTTAETLGLQIDKGLMVVDEAREKLGLGPLPNGLGRVIYRPQSNSIPLGIDGEESTDDLDFQREYVKALVADGTISDVMFNLTDAQALLQAVNIPVFQGYEEPWLPVLADNGLLVSGSVIVDEDGEIVGGDVIDGVAGEAPMPPDLDGGTDEDDVRSGKPENTMLVIGAQWKMVRAIERIATKRLQDVTGRVYDRAKKAAKKPEKFLDHIDQLEAMHGETFDNQMEEVFEMCRAYGAATNGLKAAYFNGVRTALLDAAEVQPDELIDAVSQACKRVRAGCAALARRVVYHLYEKCRLPERRVVASDN